MITQFYRQFQKWSEQGTVWILSDTHFSDEELKTGFPNRPTDEELVKHINSKVGKCDTLIHLGDVGDLNYVRQLKGYKVLICGNHDVGYTNYERKIVRHKYDAEKYSRDEVITDMEHRYPSCKITLSKEYNVAHAPFVYYWAMADNQLFDEVYSGPLMVGEKILLSHEPVSGISWAFNLHGHNHAGAPYKKGDYHYNCCLDINNYMPINMNQLMKAGFMAKIPTIHRITVDDATNRKKKRCGKPIRGQRPKTSTIDDSFGGLVEEY